MSTTPLAGWPHPESPFHDGERQVQQRLGVAEKLEVAGRRVIRDFMPDQHREFFQMLPFALIGSVDAQGHPQASVVYGENGFIASPDAHHLDIRGSLPSGDPLRDVLRPGAALGLLGIQPHTRRRNRMNGVVEQVDGLHFRMRVVRSFGNCPKYIQSREASLVDPMSTSTSIHHSDALDVRMRQLIADADTFFIATTAPEHGGTSRPHGADVSHRGGKPGFVRIDGDRQLTVPDFIGNFFFNTLGNILVNPRAGLLFIDYATGNLLYLRADARIIWDGPEVESFSGAQRLIRLTIREAMLIEQGLPLRWGPAELSPALEGTGNWPQPA